MNVLIRVPAREVPAPRSISAEAQQALAFRTTPPVFPSIDDIEGWRRLVSELDAEVERMIGPMARSVAATITDEIVAGVPSFIATPPTTRPGSSQAVLLEIHGGGLYQGGGVIARAVAGATADARRLRLVSPDYRMPPDHPYPAALDDCLAVYRNLIAEHGPENVIVGGSSAGGNLAAALVLRARDEGTPMPAGLILLSPELDLTESGDTFSTLVGIDSLGTLAPVNALYAAGRDLAEPYLSPLFADFSPGFPPTFLQSGTRDLYLSNTVRMHRALRNAGIPVECHVFEARPHLGFGGRAIEDVEVMAEIDRFIGSVL